MAVPKVADEEEETCNTSVDLRVQSSLVQEELPSFCTTLWLFTIRAIIEHSRHPTEFVYELVLQLFTGLVIGILFPNFQFQQMAMMIFLLALAIGFNFALGTMRVFGAGMLVFWREAAPGVGMGLSKPAFFVAKCIVEVPRLAVLVYALLATFYPIANPRTPFVIYFGMVYSAAWAISGFAIILSIAQDPKSAQLSAVTVCVVFCMFSGISPKLSDIVKMGQPVQTITWLSFSRWLAEALYCEETKRMDDAWRMPPSFYKTPSRESALQGETDDTIT